MSRLGQHQPHLVTPLAEVPARALRFFAGALARFSPTTLFLIGFVLLTLLTTLLLAQVYSRVPVEVYEAGDVVRANIMSPADIAGVDAGETERRRAAAAETTLPVWEYNPAEVERATQNLRSLWRDLQHQAEQRRTSREARSVEQSASEDEALTEGAIAAHRFNVNTLERLTQMLRKANAGYIYDERKAQHLRPEIRLVDARSGAQFVTATQSRFESIATAQFDLRQHLLEDFGWTLEEQQALASLIPPLIVATVTFDQEATEAARRAASEVVQPATVLLKRDQVIAREGDTITQQMLGQLSVIRGYSYTERRLHRFFGLLLITGALYWAAWKFIEHRSDTASLSLSKEKAFMLVGSAVLIETIIMRVGFTVADSMATRSMRPPLNDPVAWSFAVPFAAAALLVALLTEAHIALIVGLITALFAGLLAPYGMLMTFYAMISSSAAIYGVNRYSERQSVTLAGLFVAAVNMLIALAVIFAAQQPLTPGTVLLAVGCAVAGGLLTTIFTAGGLPINESLFGILTDVKLLELSNADLLVLGQLALRAPGTNQHSHAVSQLAEEACRAIGANVLLARIGALYHDIGKLAAPEMFVENQAGENPHNNLRPAHSARIIINHVTHGLRLAKEIGLPKQVSDFIPQHHGTRTLHFFLRKACTQAAPGELIDEAEFRYPGPKPQSKESAIMMLADSCEAATRSLSHPDMENIEAIVIKIFDAVLSDQQLDECDLTLRELTITRQSMITSLTSLYHARVDYPGFNPPSLTDALQPSTQSPLLPEKLGASYDHAADVPISRGGEVEDEAVLRGNNR